MRIGDEWGKDRSSVRFRRMFIGRDQLRGPDKGGPADRIGLQVDRGFFLHEIPAGRTIAAVAANDHGLPSSRVPWWS